MDEKEMCECGFEMGHEGEHKTEMTAEEQKAGQSLTEEGGGN